MGQRPTPKARHSLAPPAPATALTGPEPRCPWHRAWHTAELPPGGQGVVSGPGGPLTSAGLPPAAAGPPTPPPGPAAPPGPQLPRPGRTSPSPAGRALRSGAAGPPSPGSQPAASAGHTQHTCGTGTGSLLPSVGAPASQASFGGCRALQGKPSYLKLGLLGLGVPWACVPLV